MASLPGSHPRHRRSYSAAAIVDLRPLPQGLLVYSPLVMGLCRALVYVGAAVAAVGGVIASLLLAALALLAFVAGISYAAWQERLDRPEPAVAARVCWRRRCCLTVPALGQAIVEVALYLALVGAIAGAPLSTWPGGRAQDAVSRAVGLLHRCHFAGRCSIPGRHRRASAPALLARALGLSSLTLLLQKYVTGT